VPITMALAWVSALDGLDVNENWFQLNPGSLVLVLAGVALAWPARRRWLRWLVPAVLVLAGFSLLGLAGEVLPTFDQDNIGVIGLFAPALVGTALALVRARRARP